MSGVGAGKWNMPDCVEEGAVDGGARCRCKAHDAKDFGRGMASIKIFCIGLPRIQNLCISTTSIQIFCIRASNDLNLLHFAPDLFAFNSCC